MKHPLAVLRTCLGLTQVDMAALVGCSKATVQSIELGNPKRMMMSDKLAVKISSVTGVSIEWLLVGDPLRPMLDMLNNHYTFATYAEWCQRRRPGRGHAGDIDAQIERFSWQIERILKAAAKSGQLPIALLRLNRALQGIMARFPVPVPAIKGPRSSRGDRRLATTN